MKTSLFQKTNLQRKTKEIVKLRKIETQPYAIGMYLFKKLKIVKTQRVWMKEEKPNTGNWI